MKVGALLRPLRLDAAAPQGRLLARGMTSLAGLVAQGLIRLAITVAVGRLAGAADLGVVAAGMATAQFLILLWPTTCGQAASRFLARCRGAGDEESLLAVADHLRRRLLLAAGVLTAVSVPISLARGLDARSARRVWRCSLGGSPDSSSPAACTTAPAPSAASSASTSRSACSASAVS